jgi:hypothetical protein
LRYYGFEATYQNTDGEFIFEKGLPRRPITLMADADRYSIARNNYPIIPIDSDDVSCIIPIKEQFHDKLFPDLRNDPQRTLFESLDSTETRRPGNTIRKVYLCRTPMKHIERGSILIFYKSKSKLPPSQAVTAIGVFEEMALARSTEELRQLAGGRSVYSEKELLSLRATDHDPVKVINFLLFGYTDPSTELVELKQLGIIQSPPQSFQRIPTSKIRLLINRLGLGFAFP